MNIQPGDKCLITTDNWFYAPDGIQYRAVFGTVKNVLDPEQTLGLKTNRNSTNWYVEIGNMLLAGCQIHYLVKIDQVNLKPVNDASWGEHGIKEYERPSAIYDADKGL